MHFGGGAADTAAQAQFSGFATEMGGLQESVETAITTAKGDEVIRGNSRTSEQLTNFIARGATNVIPPDDSGDRMWLVQADATKVPCALINKEYALEVLGAKLPVRRVDTADATYQEVSYFVTTKGQVFCWPPYIYNDKSYITNTVTVRSGEGVTVDNIKDRYDSLAEISGTNATEPGTKIIAYFPQTDEVIIISNALPAADEGTFTKDNASLAKSKPSVFYGSKKTNTYTIEAEDSISGRAYTTSSGVATGLTFDTYDNTL